MSLRLPVLAAAAALVAAAALLAPAAGSVSAVLAENTWRLPVPDLDVLKGPEARPTNPEGDKENLGDDPPPPPVIVRTTTEITSVPERITKGSPFVVVGRVVDDEGSGVPQAPVDVYLNETKTQPGFRVAKGVTDDRGGFEIEGEVPSTLPAREYQVVATMRDSVKGQLLFLESWSDPPMVVYSDTRTNLWVPKHASTGETVTMGGKIEDVTGGPVRNVVVTLVVDGRDVATTTTGGDGTFQFTYRFMDGGAHEVIARYDGSTYYGPSRDIETIFVGGNGLEINTPRAIVRNSTLEVAGRITVEKGTVLGWPIDVAFQGLDLGPNTTMRLTTDDAGVFRAQVFIPKGVEPGTYEIEYSVPSLLIADNSTLDVHAATRLVLRAPERVPVSEVFAANATLVDDEGQPMPARGVDLVVGGVEMTGITDENGTVRWSGDLPGGGYRATATFAGDEHHRGSSAVALLAVDLTFAEAAKPWWPWVVALLVLAAITAWAIHPAGRRAIKRGIVALDPRSPVVLGFDLPNVDTDLPDVWGVGEPLALVARASTREGQPLPSLPLMVEAGAPQRLTTDAQGRVRTEVTFLAEGTVSLVAAYAGDRRRRPAETVREVRVVEYRRAIEEGFEALRRLLASRGVPVHEATPPRELERRLAAAFPALAQQDLDRLLTLFEVSDYSERPVGRDEWVVFQRARATLENALAPPAPPKRRLRPPREVALVE